MSLQPLINASWIIQLHVVLALAALILGVMQLAAPKGTISHRAAGKIWALLMLGVAATAAFIHTRRTYGPFSLIHLTVPLVFVMVPLAVWFARRHKIGFHKKFMFFIFLGALVVPGALSLERGRIMHLVLFGP